MPWTRASFAIAAWLGLLSFGSASAAEAGSLAADEQLLRANKIGTDGPALLDFFKQRTHKASDDERIAKLVRQLGDDSFDLREQASRDLINLGSPARNALQKATKDQDIEIARRAEECLAQIEAGPGISLAIAAAHLLAARKPAGTIEVLLAFIPSAEDETVAEEVRVALAAVVLKDGKVDPLLVDALSDKSAPKRSAAAVALALCGEEEHRPAVRKLLADDDARVRLKVGLALVAQKDKEAVPVLIDLLTQLRPEETWPVEDVLYRLAGDKAPSVTADESDSRKKYRDAWAGWWRERGEKLDLAKIDLKNAQLGYTLMILLDQNKIIEVDKDKKQRWQMENLQWPLDVQMLPGERVLVAEHNGNVVTERNRDGKILWKKEVEGPIMAQRLPNGHTFIASRLQLIEVDKDGKETFSYARDSEAFMKAIKLPNGDMACITDGGMCYRLNSAGKELKSFGVNLQTYGGRLEVLPNGHVLVPQTPINEVTEFDADGKAVWRKKFDQPIAAVRLSNGNTLITSMTQKQAVEVNSQGTQVWEYKTDTRVTRAFRR